MKKLQEINDSFSLVLSARTIVGKTQVENDGGALKKAKWMLVWKLRSCSLAISLPVCLGTAGGARWGLQGGW